MLQKDLMKQCEHAHRVTITSGPWDNSDTEDKNQVPKTKKRPMAGYTGSIYVSSNVVGLIFGPKGMRINEN